MILAQLRKEEEDFDSKMQMLAWQTALLMNSTGNYKKKIKPSELYTPVAEAKKKEKAKQVEHVNPEDAKKQLQEDLLSTFADSF